MADIRAMDIESLSAAQVVVKIASIEPIQNLQNKMMHQGWRIYANPHGESHGIPYQLMRIQ